MKIITGGKERMMEKEEMTNNIKTKYIQYKSNSHMKAS